MKSAVLVIGGGVAGIRATSELLQQGFKVFVLERKPRIGGRIKQLHRLFPTGEHAACTWFPLTLELVNNPNVTFLTSGELLSFQGTPGEFTAKISHLEGEDAGSYQETEISVGAVIVATGLKEQKSPSLSRFGYDCFPNILTSLELEQQLSALATIGGVLRRADGEEPRALTWIVHREGSPLSFMTASAQGLTILDTNEDAKVSILFEKRVTEGKGYERFCRDAEARGISFIPFSSLQVSETRADKLSLSCKGLEGGSAELETEMLIVSTPEAPGSHTRVLAERLGVKLTEEGFFKSAPASTHPILTSRPGIFVCGSARGSMGIDASVIQACAAASRAAVLLAPVRGCDLIPIKKNLLPIAAADVPRIAVIIAQGEADMVESLDWHELSEYVQLLAGVERVELTPSASDGTMIKELLETGQFNRLVVAGPSPITHEAVLQRHAEAAGLNRHLLEMVNLHNHCVRVHTVDKREATRKAKALMRMGLARARQLEPLEDVTVDMTRGCLVVGASPSGLACASTLAGMGHEVHLVDGAAEPESIPGNDHPLTRPLLAAVTMSERVTVHTQTRAGAVEGRIGDFRAELVKEGATEEVRVGAIVVASGTGVQEGSRENGFQASLLLEKDADGYYLSTQGILNPLDFTTAGVFNCGPARIDLETEAAVIEGEAAASRAACILSSHSRIRPAVISSVVDKNCDGCAYCVEPCPTRSIDLLDFVSEGTIKKVVEVSERTCIGCGVCMATCPKEGIFVRHYRPEYFSAMVKAALEDAPFPTIICFCCNRCSYPGADAAGLAGIQYPASVRIIRTVCTGMIHPNLVTEALTQGADGVLICGCHPGECRSREGIRIAQARSETIALLLEDFGLEGERFRLELIAASEGPKFASIAHEMTEELIALGPSAYRC